MLLDVYDVPGFVQVLADDKNKFYNEIYPTPKETLASIKGTLKNRKPINSELPPGHVGIILERHNIMTLTKNTPFLIQDETDGLEEIRLKYRYLDLRRSNMQKNIILRSNLIQNIREYLHRKEMIEIETPILTKPIDTAGEISIEHVTIFLSKYISKGVIDMKFSPYVGNNPGNPNIQRHPNKLVQKLSYV